MKLVQLQLDESIATIVLNDPAKRNALSLPMFDALDQAVARIAGDQALHIVLLRGEGPAFCAGFDLAAAVHDPALMGQYIMRLSALLRAVRRMPQLVVAAVEGAAIAGGCALLSACDFVVAAADATLGYPVHRLGVSPAVTIQTLLQKVGSGGGRALLMSGELIDGAQAQRIGLATHLAAAGEPPLRVAQGLCAQLALKGPQALRTTKAWLNELDGSLDDDRFERPARASEAIVGEPEARTMLGAWSSKPS